MKIAIAGATGLIGSELVKRFSADGHSVTIFTRKRSATTDANKISIWAPEAGRIAAEDLEGVDVVINLAGATLAVRWTESRKREIIESRVKSTRLLGETMAAMNTPPRLFMVSSAVGYYGNREPDDRVDESSESGEGFLAEVCRKWEAAAKPASAAGIRVVNLRTGVVLSGGGGPLARLISLFRKGIGGKVGSGRQMMSWLALADFYPIVRHLIANESIAGPVNLTSPNAVSNAQFTETLAKLLNRPALMTVRPFMVRMAFGEMADEVMLGGVDVYPKKLQESGYQFRFPELREALTEVVNHA